MDPIMHTIQGEHYISAGTLNNAIYVKIHDYISRYKGKLSYTKKHIKLTGSMAACKRAGAIHWRGNQENGKPRQVMDISFLHIVCAILEKANEDTATTNEMGLAPKRFSNAITTNSLSCYPATTSCDHLHWALVTFVQQQYLILCSTYFHQLENTSAMAADITDTVNEHDMHGCSFIIQGEESQEKWTCL